MGQRRKRKRAAARAAAKTAITSISPRQETKPPIIPKSEVRRIRLRKARRKAAAIYSGIATLVGFLGIYVLRPDVAIEPYATTDPVRPFGQQFSVQNTSIYSIYKVQPLCGLSDVGLVSNQLHGFSIANPSDEVAILEPGAKTTLTCAISMQPTQREMRITPWVTYKTPFGISRCKAVMFKGKPAAEGTYIWTYDGSGACKT